MYGKTGSTGKLCTQIRLLFSLFALAVLVLSTSGTGWTQSFTPSSQVSFTLQGCRNNGGIVLPNGSGQFICPDSAYTTGNLGKGWNELDLVPHRLTTQAGTQSGATTDYNVIVAADYQAHAQGPIGYDVISVPVVNPTQSDASCAVAATGFAIQPGFGGGVDSGVYSVLTVHQNKGTTCVLDYYERLALGSHNYPGASLQSYMFEDSSFSVGKKTVSIPVNQITAQSIGKTMSATQDSTIPWEISKGQTPATLLFPDTCNTALNTPKDVTITVTWAKLPSESTGAVTIQTQVFATNPASRAITITVTDKIYAGSGPPAPGATPLDTSAATTIVVPANTANVLVLTHQFTDNALTPPTSFNDVATGTYTDTVTGTPIPEIVTASASANVQPSGAVFNSTASIDDSESITGSGLSFSVAAPSFGAFSNYTAGSQTTGPVEWNSGSQSASNSITFNKTVYAVTGSSGSGLLSDTATLNGSDGFTAHATSSGITVQANVFVALTINKTVTPALTAGSQTFTFHVKNSLNAEVATPTVTLSAGQTSNSTPVTGLAPDTYTVTEDSVAGWTTDSAKSFPFVDGHGHVTCTGSVTLNNSQQGRIIVKKVTNPGGSSQSFDFSPSYGSNFSLTDGASNDSGNLLPGSYAVSEGALADWDLTNTSCDNGNNPSAITLNAGQTVTCTFTNTQRGHIIVNKHTNPAGSPQSFSFTTTGTGYAGFGLKDGESNDSGARVPGSYSVAETVPSGWDQTPAASCSDGTTTYSPSAIALAAGKTVTCDFTNVQRGHIIVNKHTAPGGSSQSFAFTTTGSGYAGFNLTDGGSNDSGALLAGNYSVAETVPAGWDQTPAASCSDGTTSYQPSAITLAAGKTVTCDFTNVQRGHIIVNKHTTPSGSSQSFAFVTTGSGYAGFNLTDGGSNDSGTLLPGSYSVAETVPAGWDQTPAASCSDGATSYQPSAITLAAGKTVTCNFTNVQRGHIVVNKTTNPSPDPTDTSFVFGTTGTGYSGFSLKNGGSNDSGALLPGNYSVAETVPAGWDQAPAASCSDGTNTYQPSAITLVAGKTVTCNFTNTGRGSIKVVKNTVGGDGAFSFTSNFGLTSLTTTSGTANHQFDNLAAGSSYHVSEPVPAGWDLTSSSCDHGTPSAVTVLPGQTTTCVFTNTRRGKAQVIKTLNGAPPFGSLSFTFQIRQGASGTAAGTILETKYATAANGGVINFVTWLAPAATYSLCETVMPGWMTTLGPPFFVVYNPSGDNSTVCTNFTVQPGQTRTFTIDNTTPPGGFARTIGFWKNWASCSNSNGKQKPILDQTLALAEPGGITVGILNLQGSTVTPNVAPSCLAAVAILSKQTISTRKSMSSDPAFNMAAQLLGADLNVQAGAGACPALVTAINSAQSLLAAILFDGNTHLVMTSAQKTQANSLQTQLNLYNNNNFAFCQ